VFNATFNNISVVSRRSVSLVEETGVPVENHRSTACHWRTLFHNVVSSTPYHEQYETGVNSEKYTYEFFLQTIRIDKQYMYIIGKCIIYL